MKKIKISVLALATLALGACTNDDVVLTDSAILNDGGDSYISFAINMPTTSSTRAANDVYDDGLATEYNVNDATLYLFQGTTEAAAMLYASYSLTGAFDKYEPDDDNITSRQSFTQQITRPTSGNLYALVVVNGTGVTSNFTTGTTLATLQSTATYMDVATIASVSDGGNFYMTNAPLWKGTRGGYVAPTYTATGTDAGGVTTLAYIDSSKIYDTEAEALANPATEIYVERGVAKVTVNGENANSTLTDNKGNALNVTVNGFVLDLTNLTGYPVRNSQTSDLWWTYASATLDGTTVGANQYRFVGDQEVAADLYRTYWATDVNYNENMYDSGESGARVYPSTVKSLGGTIPTALTAADGVTGAYCLENTFNVAHQNQDETTRAIIAVTVGTDGDFYTLEGDKSVLYSETEILKEVLALFAANGDIENAIESSWIGGDFEYSTYYTASIDKTNGGTSDATVSVAYNGNFNTDDFKDSTIPTILTSFDSVVAQINADNEFSYYAGGVAYYPVMIKHFGDDLTPWDIQGVSGESYPNDNWSKTAEENWLGRYGVLRNNWYDIQVTAVNKLGSADVPTAYGEPDDPIESWISVYINILSWAKRTQSVTL